MSASFAASGPWLAALCAPVLAALAVRALIGAAPRLNLIDRPGGRKTHEAATPLVGGLGIFAAYLAACLLAGGIPGGSQSLLVAMAVTVLIGVADDAHEIGHRSKFFAQIVAALVVVSGTSMHMTHFGDLFGRGDILLGKWAPLVTVVAIIGLMNAINMIDGLDGLAGTVVFFPLLLLAGVAAAHGEPRMALELVILAGATAGFLFHNLRTPWRARAAAFMGDTGGLLLGLLLAWYSIGLAGHGGSALAPITAVWILAVPLLDMGSVMLLRILRRRSPFQADRMHLHYLLLDAGYTVGQVVAMLSLASLACGALALLAVRAGAAEPALFMAFMALWAGYLFVLAKGARAAAVAARIVRPRGTAGPCGLADGPQ